MSSTSQTLTEVSTEPAGSTATTTADARVLSRETWMEQAVCVGRTPLFFGLAGERPERRARREARARKLCAQCPVLEPCRLLARKHGENGFWGGESEEERAAAG